MWSAIVITKYGTERQLSCRPCGRRKQALSLAGCAVAGWWGIPFGLIFTPLAIVTNLAKLAGGPRPDAPSPQLVQLVRQSLARRAA